MRILSVNKRRSAAHAVEFAIVCPVVLLLLFGILDIYSVTSDVDEDHDHPSSPD